MEEKFNVERKNKKKDNFNFNKFFENSFALDVLKKEFTQLNFFCQLMVKLLLETPILQTDFTKFIFTNLFKENLQLVKNFKNQNQKCEKLKILFLEFIDDFFKKNYSDQEAKLKKSSGLEDGQPLTIIKSEMENESFKNIQKPHYSFEKKRTSPNLSIISKENYNHNNIPQPPREMTFEEEFPFIKSEYIDHLKFLENQFLFYKNRFEVFSKKVNRLMDLKSTLNEKDSIEKDNLHFSSNTTKNYSGLKKRSFDDFQM